MKHSGWWCPFRNLSRFRHEWRWNTCGPTPGSYLESVAVGDGKQFFCRGVATGKLSVTPHPLSIELRRAGDLAQWSSECLALVRFQVQPSIKQLIKMSSPWWDISHNKGTQSQHLLPHWRTLKNITKYQKLGGKCLTVWSHLRSRALRFLWRSTFLVTLS